MNAARTNYILVDYENVQPTPEELALLREHLCKVKVFVGARQTKLPAAFAAAMQSLGSNGEYVLMKASGANALDFHIAYYIGLLTAQDPKPFFHILSKDEDYVKLMEYLNASNVPVRKSKSIADISYFQRLVPATIDDLVKAATEKLQKQKRECWPSTEKSLRNWLCSVAGRTLTKEEQDQSLVALAEREVVKVRDNGKLKYSLQTSA